MKALKRFINKLRFLRTCLRFIQVPERTEEVFVLSDQLANPEDYQEAIALLKKVPEIKTMIDTRYRPSQISHKISDYAPGTLGHAYIRHLAVNKLDPNFYSLLEVKGDIDYIRNRMRETHDIWHVVMGFNTDRVGEAGLGAVYVAQTSSRVMALVVGMFIVHSVLFDASKLKEYFEQIVRGWKLGKASSLLLAQRWEERLHENLDDIRLELGIRPFFEAATPAEMRPMYRAPAEKTL